MPSDSAGPGSRPAWPLLASILLFGLLLGAIVWRSVWVCGGHFGYPLDDTYIHMAIAKNFVLHGVWGTTKYAFTSSTSSPFYSLLLAVCYALTGVRELTPIALNIAASVALLLWCDFAASRAKWPARWRFGLLAFLVIAIPLPVLAFAGMEHVVHTLLTLIFLYVATDALLDERTSPARLAILFGVTSVIVVIRYEAAFPVAIAGLLFLMRQRWAAAAGLALAAALPVAAYGWVSVAHGWYAIPNSLLLKANLPATHSFGLFPAFLQGLIVNVTQGFHITLLLMLALFLLGSIVRRFGTIWRADAVALVLFSGTAALHLLLARVGWFFRYEAYLIAFGAIGVAMAVRPGDLGLRGRRLSVPVILMAALVCFTGYRAFRAFYRTPQAVSDIWSQQYQMARFAERYLGGKTLVLNDIGAASFLSEARVLDLIGLGSFPPAEARRKGLYSRDWLRQWARDNRVSVAIVYPQFAPAEWKRVATWTIPGNYMSGSDSVGIYALDAAAERTLRDGEQAFARDLPSRVVRRSEEQTSRAPKE